ncbi:MAG: hypothetical protein JOZ75_01960 [Candidatus Dormibacteraeota bacterium]|nr:hypothetical protein [Candidatus Dormibacteraeota bacterium]
MTCDPLSKLAARAPRLRRRRGIAPPAVLLLLLPAVLVLAACGSGSPGVANLGGGSSPSPSSSGPGSGSKAQGLEAFSQCMRGHGIAGFPDPGSGGGLAINGNDLAMDPNSPQFQAAQQACSKYLPNGGKVSPSQQAAMEQQALKFSQCMRAHGIANFPDPQFHSGPGGGGVELQVPTGVDPQSPQFQAAQSACQSDLPKPPGGGTTNRGGGSGGGPIVK